MNRKGCDRKIALGVDEADGSGRLMNRKGYDRKIALGAEHVWVC
jgi:hypothetical protein